MKKSLITLAVLAASGAASAQSSVTLFGVVDATVRYATTLGLKDMALAKLIALSSEVLWSGVAR